MKHPLLFALLLMLGISACYRDKLVSILSNESFLADTNDSTLSTLQILNKYTPSILAQLGDDSSVYYYGYNMIDEDTIWRCMIVGKLLDNKRLIAVEANLPDTTMRFYELIDRQWLLRGEAKINIDLFVIKLEDLDGDGDNEILASTFGNMNGNSWKEAYVYSHKADTIQYAGDFSSDYKVDKARHQIQVTYTGSWYMDEIETLYEWRNERIVPVKQLVLNKEHNQNETNNGMICEYYENHTDSINGLKLVRSEAYINYSKFSPVWDNFFDEIK